MVGLICSIIFLGLKIPTMNYAVAKLLFCFTSQSLLTISIATLEANTNIKTNLQGKFRSERIRKYCLYSVRLEI